MRSEHERSKHTLEYWQWKYWILVWKISIFDRIRPNSRLFSFFHMENLGILGIFQWKSISSQFLYKTDLIQYADEILVREWSPAGVTETLNVISSYYYSSYTSGVYRYLSALVKWISLIKWENGIRIKNLKKARICQIVNIFWRKKTLFF